MVPPLLPDGVDPADPDGVVPLLLPDGVAAEPDGVVLRVREICDRPCTTACTATCSLTLSPTCSCSLTAGFSLRMPLEYRACRPLRTVASCASARYAIAGESTESSRCIGAGDVAPAVFCVVRLVALPTLPTHAFGCGHKNTSAECGPARQNELVMGRSASVAPTLVHEVPFGHLVQVPLLSR